MWSVLMLGGGSTYPWATAYAQEEAAHALHADKRIYFSSMQVSYGVMGAGYDNDTTRFTVLARPENHVVVDGVFASSPPDFYSAPGYDYWRREDRSWRAGGGVAVAPLGTGIHGPRIGVRAVAGPAHFDSFEYRVDPDDVPPAVHEGARVEIQPYVAVTWIGHPGITLGLEAGMSQDVCCDHLVSEARLRGYGLATVGWSFASPTAIPWDDPLAAVPDSKQSLRRTQNRVLGYSLLGAAGAVSVLIGSVLAYQVVVGPSF